MEVELVPTAARCRSLAMFAPFGSLFAPFGVSLTGDPDHAEGALVQWAFLMPEAIPARAPAALAELNRHHAWWRLADGARRRPRRLRGREGPEPARWDPRRHLPRRAPVWTRQIAAGGTRASGVCQGTRCSSTPSPTPIAWPGSRRRSRTSATATSVSPSSPGIKRGDRGRPHHPGGDGRGLRHGALQRGDGGVLHDSAGLERVRTAIGAALAERGFAATRRHVYGERAGVAGGGPGLPAFAGMAVGFREVKRICEASGTSIVEATFLPVDETVRRLSYFDSD